MGTVTPIGKPRKRTCQMCNGRGTVPIGDGTRNEKTCPNCEGRGEL